MDAYQLPEFLNVGKECEMYIHYYRSDKLYLKNKVKLNKNLICILLNGTKEVFSQYRSVRIDNTEMLLISTGNVLMWESIAKGNKLESLLIFFSNEILREFCLKHKLDFSGDSENPEAVLSIKKDSYLLAYEQSLKALGKDHLLAIQQLKVEELLVYLGLKNRSGHFYAFVKNALGTARENKLRDVVAANIAKGLSIDELAFLCNMSVSTFKRHFEKVYRCSPKKYFTNKRMEKAKEMLLLDKRPSEIFLELHYQNLSSFSTEFKKYFGVSPRQFLAEAEIRTQ